MNERQKTAVLVFRIVGVISIFLGLSLMASKSHPYPVSGISDGGAVLFVFVLLFLYALPGTLMIALGKTLGKWVGRDL